MQRITTYWGETWLLSGYVDCTVRYESPKIYNLATNLIVVEAKKSNLKKLRWNKPLISLVFYSDHELIMTR